MAPVIFIVFNRPQETAAVFQRIRAARPSRLYVVADGPRPGRPADAEKCAAVRKIIDEGVDWPCETIKDYAATNLGCRDRVYSGITTAFAEYEEAIILEDDCLPDLSFFQYCTELLERYRHTVNIALISGSHHQLENRFGPTSYYFCRYGNIWGWATWRRVWQTFDLKMGDWRQWELDGGVQRTFTEPKVASFWGGIWRACALGRSDSWDYQWTYCYMHQQMIAILPYASLVENIGFGRDATHLAGERIFSASVVPMEFPLRHPDSIVPDLRAEAVASARFFTREPFAMRAWKSIKRRILTRVRSVTKR